MPDGYRDEDELYDLYLDACASGQAVDPAEFCARHGLGDEPPAWLTGLHRMMLGPAVAPAEDDARPALRAGDGLPFERLGEFRLLRRIGRGGMGSVYLAEQESLGRLVALKVLHADLHASPTASERFRREARAIARLQHAHITRVFGVGEQDGTRFFAMELVPGQSLAEEKGPLPVARVLRWGRAIARALAHAHGEGIVHRDVKPANIRITPDDRALLVDFGVARDEQAAGATITQMFTGSPLYAAPEQLRGEKVDGRADVYALGVTLYECLTGRVPFAGDNVEQVVARILRGDPAPPRKLMPSLPADLETVILKAIARDPAERYETAGAFADDLDALLELRPVSARPPAWTRRVRMAAGRRPALTATVATLVIAGIIALGWDRVSRARAADDAIADARGRVEAYRARRAETRNLERDVAELQRGMHAQYMTDDQHRLLDTKERDIARLRRKREEDFYAVLDLLRRAETLGAVADEIAPVRAALFAEKWDEARAVRDRVGQAFYEERIKELGVDVPLGGRWEGRVTFRFKTEPPGAAVYAFRYREGETEPRMMPVPWNADAALDRWALHVVKPAGDLRWGDVVTSVNGHPIRDCLLAAVDRGAVKRGDRLVAIDGKPARSMWDVDELGEGLHTYRFATAGETQDPPPVAPVHEVAPGLHAEIHRRGSMMLPAGVVLRPTAAPLVLDDASRIGTTPCEIETDADEFCFVFRIPGRHGVRFGYRSKWSEMPIEARLRRLGTIPAGFVPVIGETLGEEYWFMEREVTAAEYLAFLNDPATLREIDASEDPIRYPRGSGGAYLERRADGRFTYKDEWRPDWPALGVSFEDAQAYARWRSARDGLAYRLPTWRSWILATHCQLDRRYPFGDTFRPKWIKSCYARPRAIPEPVMRFPRDESPTGLYDLCGGVMEWIDDWYDEPRGLRRIGGGSWARAKPESFEIWGQGAPPDLASGEYGFRLMIVPEAK